MIDGRAVDGRDGHLIPERRARMLNRVIKRKYRRRGDYFEELEPSPSSELLPNRKLTQP